MDIRVLKGPELIDALDEVAQLRITVFNEFPYLYDGSLEYERKYLASYAESDASVLVGALDGKTLVGAATGTPMSDHASEFAQPLAKAGLSVEETFYCAESVLLSSYRGQGAGHAFFDLREAHARNLGAKWSVFCSVIRPADHPLRPDSYSSLDPFWRKRGYAPFAGCVAEFEWKDVDATASSAKQLQIWGKHL